MKNILILIIIFLMCLLTYLLYQCFLINTEKYTLPMVVKPTENKDEYTFEYTFMRIYIQILT